jgi:hypothetical protein
MDTFSSNVSSLAVLIISVALIVLNWKEKSPVWIIPLVYFTISLSTLIFGKTILLKFGPVAISLGVAMLLSMKDKTPAMIQQAINRWKFFRQKHISIEQIRSNTWLWTVAAWLNVALHIYFLAFMSKWLWAFYVSIGWYMVFALALIVHIYIWQKRKRGI